MERHYRGELHGQGSRHLATRFRTFTVQAESNCLCPGQASNRTGEPMSHLAPLFLAIAISPAAQEQHTTVTPAWAKQNPGRFQFSMGSAFDGSNGVSLRLVSTGASSHFRVIARVWKKTKAGRKRVMGWDVQCAGARKSMFWQMSLWPDETREVEFTIVEFPTAGKKAARIQDSSLRFRSRLSGCRTG